MTTIETLIQATLANHPEVRLAILFGSLATGQGHHDSDVDLAIDAGQPLGFKESMSLMAELAESTGCPVDLIDLQTVGEPLLGQILRHGKRLLGKDSLYAELIKRHVFDEADFMPYYRRILRERRSAWIEK
ncbi:DNA polymerase III subunit beta [Sulfuricella sp. T08]|uniref:type VII toxin-antitoxin system MntA family adenylyltransferase antitoxin n=1 Tax=Sulfuricella sp. T08 TaxID=1632857 RepID=UPI0006179F08|nr:nucleotidyltransferase domain-containing protein [Sulfuricella sp. T08]GAO37047.1 DNA polymerase III subunit beta [Sulfuricella sp. T08]